jgi:hypothetical protein
VRSREPERKSRRKKGVSVDWLSLLHSGAGASTVALGTAHFFLPTLLDVRTVILERPADWKAPHPCRLWPTAYVATQLPFGRRWGDRILLAWFATLGPLHLWIALR